MKTPDRFMTNTKTLAAQLVDSSINGNNHAHTRANRRVDATTISEIARLCARQLSESEACRKIGIVPQAWFSWKSRHNRSEKFAALLEEFRAGRIDDLITKIEKSADGIGLKQPDWRAAAALLKFVDMKRFGDSPQVASNNTPHPIVSESSLKEILDRVFGAKAVKIESAPVPKQIQDAQIVPDSKKP